MLIDAGADLDALNQAGVCGSPLHLSVSKANAGITKEIIKKGECSVIDIQLQNPEEGRIQIYNH